MQVCLFTIPVCWESSLRRLMNEADKGKQSLVAIATSFYNSDDIIQHNCCVNKVGLAPPTNTSSGPSAWSLTADWVMNVSLTFVHQFHHSWRNPCTRKMTTSRLEWSNEILEWSNEILEWSNEILEWSYQWSNQWSYQWSNQWSYQWSNQWLNQKSNRSLEQSNLCWSGQSSDQARW